MRARDLFHPPVVTETEDGEIRLVSGTARRDATLIAIEQFPELAQRFRYPLCLFIDEPSPEDWMLRTYEENSIRREIDPIREAEYFRHLKTQEGLTQREIAGLLGVSEAHVSSRLALPRDPKVRQRVEKGEILPTSAREEMWARGSKRAEKGSKPRHEERGQGPISTRMAPPRSGDGTGLSVLTVLDEMATKREEILERVEALGREDQLSLGIEPGVVQRLADRIVEHGLRLRRAVLR